MAEKIIADANDRADIITGAIKDRCDGVIAEFRQQLQAEKEKAWIMRTRIIDFKKQVYELYGAHIAELKDLSVNEIEDIVLPNDDALVANIFNDVKGRIEEETQRRKTVRELKTEAPQYANVAKEAEEEAEAQLIVAEEKTKTEQPELSEEAKNAEDEYLKYMMGESKPE